MKGAALTLLLCLLTGCGAFPSLGLGDSSDGGSSGASAPSSSTAATADAGPKGVDCIVEPESGAQLCSGMSTCPGLLVDHDLYPRCGFRPGGTVLDLECSCQGSLCPVGVAQTCEQAKKLLDSQSEASVCVQLSEGRCTKGTAPASTAPSASTCDKGCAAECGNVPTCLKLCGC